MQNDRKIQIAIGQSRKTKTWTNQTVLWSEFADRLKSPVQTEEYFADFKAWSKAKQDEIKDVGGFVGGYLKDGRRKPENVIGRDLITLDADNIPPGGTQGIIGTLDAMGCAYAVYSTRKHEGAAPRLRLVFPLDRTAAADEYQPVARRVASYFDAAIFDPTTFQESRLMYWPSISRDSEYVYKCADKPWLSVDGLLNTYNNWRNTAEWPQVPGETKKIKRDIKRQGDPEEKNGTVGAFCRIYDIPGAIEKFLPDEYTPCDIPDRYTYAHGSTAAGAVLYENGKFLYSHHATDPCSGRLVNAFDLVRLHMFGDMDDDAKDDTPTPKLPSYSRMCEYALKDDAVRGMCLKMRLETAKDEFGGTQDSEEWTEKLKIHSKTGLPLKTIDNTLIILNYDPMLRGKIGYDEMMNRPVALGKMPWDRAEDTDAWTGTDDAGLRHYLERVYDITGKERIADAFALCARAHIINRLKDYLTGLCWDGKQRLDTLFTDYLGAEDNAYTRAVARKSLVAAVARAIQPGCKYDCMPILVGPQGIGKSTMLKILGGEWFSDSLQCFEGKEAAEMLKGTWINEIGELNGFSRTETSNIKQFLSKTDDIYREPYERRTSVFPRRCVFFGTTNDAEFLRDRTGNRRFWPVEVPGGRTKKSVFSDLENERDQIWAEAAVRFAQGEPLYLAGDAEKISIQTQAAHMDTDPREGMIIEFLAREVPEDWTKMSIDQRMMFWAGAADTSIKTVPRSRVCVMEIWRECLGGTAKDIKSTDKQMIRAVLSSQPDWERVPGAWRFGPYGVVKGSFKKKSVTFRKLHF